MSAVGKRALDRLQEDITLLRVVDIAGDSRHKFLESCAVRNLPADQHFGHGADEFAERVLNDCHVLWGDVHLAGGVLRDGRLQA